MALQLTAVLFAHRRLARAFSAVPPGALWRRVAIEQGEIGRHAAQREDLILALPVDFATAARLGYAEEPHIRATEGGLGSAGVAGKFCGRPECDAGDGAAFCKGSVRTVCARSGAPWLRGARVASVDGLPALE
jgi:hypothetical protein